MNSIPTAFTNAVHVLLTDLDASFLDKMTGRKWTTNSKVRLLEKEYRLELRCSRTKTTDKWYFLFLSFRGEPVSIDVVKSHIKNLQLTHIQILRKDDFSDTDATEISFQQLQDQVIPLIQAHLGAHPQVLEIDRGLNVPDIDFGNRKFTELTLPYTGPNSLKLVRSQVDSNIQFLRLLGKNWPKEYKKLLQQFITELPFIYTLISDMKLPRECFYKLFDRFFRNDMCWDQVMLQGPMNLKFSYLEDFYKHLQVKQFSKTNVAWETQDKRLQVFISQRCVTVFVSDLAH